MHNGHRLSIVEEAEWEVSLESVKCVGSRFQSLRCLDCSEAIDDELQMRVEELILNQ
jgi:hypothetical protein